MIDRIDKHRDTQRVWQKDELPTRGSAHLAGAREELCRLLPFGLCG